MLRNCFWVFVLCCDIKGNEVMIVLKYGWGEGFYGRYEEEYS